MTKDEQWLLTEKYHGEKSAGFFTDCKRLESGEPLGYIIGHVPFLNCTIYLDNKPLIPRPETEYWVEHAIESIRKAGYNEPLILDLCAGSGCIGVAVGCAISDARITFADIDETLSQTIERNCARNCIPERNYHITNTDLFRGINDRFDIILSNPPYIDREVGRTEHSVAEHEPAKALYGGQLGLELIERIITESPTHLNESGQLWLEHEPEQAAAIQTLAAKHRFLPTTHVDQYQVARYSILVLK